ncbi:hypothetical protein Goari_009918 [Gossypium aridum]|uniref:Uncharacterized protein n=1 Tax=Gossypium aridum TaxID=34290 RepID=A0A7J8XYE3_GOSAI|nr:hypothetical protein [Gossypium aridum]
MYECIEQAHPDAKGFRGKQIEMYDELKIVCGNYQAPSRWAKMKDGSYPMGYKNFEEDSASFVSPSSDDLSDTDGTESYSGQPEYLHEGSQDPPVMEPLRQLPKRPRESDVLQEAMLAVASSIRRLADAMDQSKTAINPSELLQAVLEIDGLEEAKQMYAFEYLNADPIKARAFMTYNVRMRKMYLFQMNVQISDVKRQSGSYAPLLGVKIAVGVKSCYSGLSKSYGKKSVGLIKGNRKQRAKVFFFRGRRSLAPKGKGKRKSSIRDESWPLKDNCNVQRFVQARQKLAL